MIWSYDDPANISKDEVRLIIGDTDKNYPKLYDEEIVFYLTKHGSASVAAYYCAKAILMKLATEPEYTIGPETINNSATVKQLESLIKELDPMKSQGVPYPPPTGTSIFDIGMMDNGSSYY